MNAPGADPKVKKIYVRNCEKKITSKTRKEVVRDVDQNSAGLGGENSSKISQKNNALSEPTLCSSAALANYLGDMRRSLPPRQSNDDLNIDTGDLCSKVKPQIDLSSLFMIPVANASLLLDDRIAIDRDRYKIMKILLLIWKYTQYQCS